MIVANMKTTEGFAIEVAGRTYDDVWPASDAAVSAMLDVVDRDKTSR